MSTPVDYARSPKRLDPPTAEDTSPDFKDQVHENEEEPSTAAPVKNRKTQRETPTIPIAEATPIVEARISNDERMELQSELERQRAELEEARGHQPPTTVPYPQQFQQPTDQLPTALAAIGLYSLSKKTWIGIGIVFALVVLVVVASVCGSGNCGGSSSASPTPGTPRSPTAPTGNQPSTATLLPTSAPVMRSESILSFINSITLTRRNLTYPSMDSPEERALQWLIDKDLNTRAVDNEQALRQRYALTTLWFVPTPTPFGDAEHSNTWTTNLNECEWEDVQCDTNKRITALTLFSTNVRGRIPADLGLLTDLTDLQLWNNTITGTIPPSFGSLTALSTLWLFNNQLMGTIPASLKNLTDLTSMSLRINRLTGTIPSYLGELKALGELSLSENQLNGTIPSSLGRLVALSNLQLFDNQLTGTIPSYLGELTALTEVGLGINQLIGTIPASLESLKALAGLWLDENQLSGTIPSSLGNLVALTLLWLYDNPMNGTIPSTLGALTALVDLQMDRTGLSGSIPSEFGNLTALTRLDLYDNQLTGPIPSSLAASLITLQLHDNMLTGTIPSFLGDLTALTHLLLYNNELNGTVPFCGLDPTLFTLLVTDCIDVNCTCCTQCCPGPWENIEGYSEC